MSATTPQQPMTITAGHVETGGPTTAGVPARFRVPATDGLRTLAALSILSFHTYMTMRWVVDANATTTHVALDHAIRLSSIRVDMFFVLSAFLLFMPFARSLLFDAPPPSMRRFARRRIWRILPLYAVLLAVSAATQMRPHADSRQLLLNATFTWPYVPGGERLMVPSWTLAIEIGFYLLLPVLVITMGILVRSLTSVRARALVLTCSLLPFIAFGPGVRAGIVSAPGPLRLHNTIISRFDAFAIGMVAAVVVMVLAHRGRLDARRSLSNPVLVVSAIALAAAGTWLAYERLYAGAFASPLEHLLKALAIAFLLVGIARGAGRSNVVRIMDSAPMRWLGERSYGIFLWHCIVLWALAQVGLLARTGVGGYVVNVLVATALSALLASITLRYVERPAMRRA